MITYKSALLTIGPLCCNFSTSYLALEASKILFCYRQEDSEFTLIFACYFSYPGITLQRQVSYISACCSPRTETDPDTPYFYEISSEVLFTRSLEFSIIYFRDCYLVRFQRFLRTRQDSFYIKIFPQLETLSEIHLKIRHIAPDILYCIQLISLRHR